MLMQSRFLLVLLTAWLPLTSLCQSIDSNPKTRYLIVTIARQRLPSQHNVEFFYRIVSQDSIKSNPDNLAQLALEGYSKQGLENCCLGKETDPFVTTTESKFDYDVSYISQLKALNSIIQSRGRTVQTIAKQWMGKQKEVLTVRVIPLSGSFCYCMVPDSSSSRRKLIVQYLPLGDFRYDESFWASSAFRKIESMDFSGLQLF